MSDKSPQATGNSISLGKNPRDLIHHPTDFSVAVKSLDSLVNISGLPDIKVQRLAHGMLRVSSKLPEDRDRLMDDARRTNVAHHIYLLEDTGEEIVIDDRIFLRLKENQQNKLSEICQNFALEEADKVGETHVLKVTDKTGRNPLKAANEISQLDGVLSSRPNVMAAVQASTAPSPAVLSVQSLAERYKLFNRQWYLTTNFITDSDTDVSRTASINAHEAWVAAKSFGSPEIVIAVIDDGFDLPEQDPVDRGHPVFRNKIINSNGEDFLDGDLQPLAVSDTGDFHGTPVASLATASLGGDGMLGVAPGCAFMPLRISLGPNINFRILLKALETASEHADVVNCSFNLVPGTVDQALQNDWFVKRVAEIAEYGGRRKGKGLVIVFSAGNDDAPIRLSAERNKNGLRFAQKTDAGVVPGIFPAGIDLYAGFPVIPGTIIVGAMSSLKRKAGYSNWGSDLTITAPSNNDHEIKRFTSLDPEFRKDFVVDYPGRGLVAGINRLDNGVSFQPIDGSVNGIPNFTEENYTEKFGETSGAAALVTGVVALILSVNPDLKASQVIQILKDTADKNLNQDLDLKNDPNLKGLSGNFVAGQSIFFGAGKVDAAAAVRRAIEMRG